MNLRERKKLDLKKITLNTKLPKINTKNNQSKGPFNISNKGYQESSVKKLFKVASENESSMSEADADPVNLFNSVLSLTENDRPLVHDIQKRLNDQKREIQNQALKIDIRKQTVQ